MQQIHLGNQIDGPRYAYTAPDHCRTQAQFDALLQFHNNPENNVAFWSSDSLRPELPGQKFSCTFWHHYFTKDGVYKIIKVTPTGRIEAVR